jgi:hypothetical protein
VWAVRGRPLDPDPGPGEPGQHKFRRLRPRQVEPITSRKPHLCRSTRQIHADSTAVPLLSTTNQWGALPFLHSGLSPESNSQLTRDFLDGKFVIHRDLPYPGDDTPSNQEPARVAAPAPYTRAASELAWTKRRTDLSELADVADTLSDVDRRIAISRTG